MFGTDSLVEAAKPLVKTAVLAVVLWRVLAADLPALLAAPFANPHQLAARALAPSLHVLLVVLAAQGGIAAIDLFWVVLRHARNLRMRRRDVKEEQKETEGDP